MKVGKMMFPSSIGVDFSGPLLIFQGVAGWLNHQRFH